MIRYLCLFGLVAALAACTPPAKDYAAENRLAPAAPKPQAAGPAIKFSGYARYGVKVIN